EVGDLLRRSGAFDRARGHREDSGSPAQALDELPGLWGQVEPVVARHVRSVDGLGHAGDVVPIELEARADDEVVVVDLGLGGEGARVSLRSSGWICVTASLIQATPWGITSACGRTLSLRSAAPPPTSVHSGW